MVEERGASCGAEREGERRAGVVDFWRLAPSWRWRRETSLVAARKQRERERSSVRAISQNRRISG
jgi:hypothetical protein